MLQKITKTPTISSANRGFSIIELLVFLAISGVILAMAVPAYSSYHNSARLSMAGAKLSQIAMLLEAEYSEARHYQFSVTALDVVSVDQWFTYSINNDDPQHYKITATPAAEGNMETVLELDHIGYSRYRKLGTTQWHSGWPS